jgi:hypothetical protein
MMKQRKFDAMSHLGMVNADAFGSFRLRRGAACARGPNPAFR